MFTQCVLHEALLILYTKRAADTSYPMINTETSNLILNKAIV